MRKGYRIALVTVMLMMLSTLSVFAETEYLNDEHTQGRYTSAATENSLETDFTWDYNKDTKTLLIIGYGTIPSSETPDLGYTAFKNEIEIIQMMTITGDYSCEIGDKAFYSFKNLKKIHLATNVTRIGKDAFCFCKKLENIDIPNRVSEIDEGAFQYCEALKTVNIPDGITTLHKECFCGCESLEGIEIPESVTSIGKYCFEFTYSMLEVSIPNGVKTIGMEAFACGPENRYVQIPTTITAINESAFNKNKNLEIHYMGTLEQWEQIENPSEAYEMEDYQTGLNAAKLFYDFDGSYYVPGEDIVNSGTWEGVNWILTSSGDFTISGEGPMKDTLYYSKSWDKISSNIGKIIIGEGITRVGNYCFFAHINTRKVVIPDSVTSIGTRAFYGNEKLRIIWMGSGLQTIEERAFAETNNIKTIIYNGTQEQWDTITIEKDNDGIKNAQLICLDNGGDDSTPPAPPAPEKPKLKLNGKATKKSITYTWNKVEGAKTYKIYQARSNVKTLKRIATTKSLKYKAKGLKSKKIYKAYVVAYDKNGKKIVKSQTIKVKTK